MYDSPVVKVFTTSMESCFDLPWQRKRPQKGRGSGVYLGNQMILTGAHVVHDATFIQVQKLSDPDRTIAEILSVCHDADLALLTVKDDTFFDDLTPASLGALPELKSRVEVVGFPTGGEQVSVTYGVVSRIEANFYSHSWRHLLCVTIDAAINPGNSGGPVFNEAGGVVGIAFQKNTNAENSGQMIPPPVIESFLAQAKQGQSTIDIPSLGLATQSLENPCLKRHFDVPEGESGVLITKVVYGSTTYGHLEPGDILHQINEYPISSLGTILYRGKYRTELHAVLSELAVGDEVQLMTRRAGQLNTLKVSLKKPVELAPRGETPPNHYFIFGGVVFQPLTRKYLQTWKNLRAAPVQLNYAFRAQVVTESLREVVVISHILSDEVNVGYAGLCYHIISEVNGEQITDLNHLASLLEVAEGVIKMKTAADEWLLLDASLVRERDPEILRRYQIPERQRGIHFTSQ